MHFNVKAMKLISSTLAAFLMYSTLYAFQTYDQNLAYTHPAIVVKDGVSYTSTRDVSAGTPFSTDIFANQSTNTPSRLRISIP